jgi:hypothetical protein
MFNIPGRPPRPSGKPDPLRRSDHPPGAQVGGQLLAQGAAGLHEQGAVDALVGDLHLLILGVGGLEPVGDLLRGPPSLQLLRHDLGKGRVGGQLAGFGTCRPRPHQLVRGAGPVSLAATVGKQATSRLIVEADRPSLTAIARNARPAASPREISSRSVKIKECCADPLRPPA